ncbi:MAG: helix-turn-helix domain-containing protein [Nitrospinae bacterium]|nr:helix-turn-helix domain-containing protein [Nitrospinota bacterium]
METLGEFLQRERQLRQISLDEVAESTKISRRHLEAIEEGRYGSLPGEAFVRGFIRSYVKYMGLDPEEAMLMYHGARPTRDVSVTHTVRTPPKRNLSPARPLLWFLLVGLVVMGVALFSTVTLLKKSSRFLPGFLFHTDVAASPKVAPPLMLSATADSDTWLFVTIDGKEQQDVLLRVGQSVQWRGNDRFMLSIGNARATRLKLNGRELTVPLGPQNILRHYVVSRDMLHEDMHRRDP